MTEREELIEIAQLLPEERLNDAIVILEAFCNPDDETNAILEESLRQGTDINADFWDIDSTISKLKILKGNFNHE